MKIISMQRLPGSCGRMEMICDLELKNEGLILTECCVFRRPAPDNWYVRMPVKTIENAITGKTTYEPYIRMTRRKNISFQKRFKKAMNEYLKSRN